MSIFPAARYLDINLSKLSVESKYLDGKTYRNYPGGSILGLYLLMNNMDPTVEPLSSENVLVFSTSPLTGLPISGISRVCVTTKSPLTNTIADSQAGGFFPAHMKMNGYDAIMIRGKAEKPVYLYIDGDHVELRDASNIWGKITGEAEELIRKDLNEENVEIAQIGPGGENLVKYAAIINMCNRANGRNGTGAVMGSKFLKAIVIKKGKAMRPYDPAGFKELAGSVVKRLNANESVSGLGKYGTAGDLKSFSQDGFLPTRNWTTGYFPEGEDSTDGATMYDTILKERDTCFGCAVRCKRVVEIEGKVDPLYGGPEYETMATFGSYCGVTDLETISYANQLCNMYGIDTISCGATIAFAMEAFERGLIDENTTGGLNLNFGNTEVIPTLVEMIAHRKDFGNLLAEGSKYVSEYIGNGAQKLFMGVKGQELPAHMPQYKPAVGMIYAVNPFGADHQSSEHDPFLVMPEDSQERKWIGKLGIRAEYDNPFVIDDEKVRFALESQKYFSVLDSLCLCQFVWGPCWELYGPDDLLGLCASGIGWETSIHELLLIGERRINMMRYFNMLNGFTKNQDKLPERLFEPMPEGASKGVQLDKKDFYNALDQYYEFAGWDQHTGNPTSATLRKLKLEWLLDRFSTNVKMDIA